ncbi:hypothetical protein B0I18_11669 [Taibaiella chishuiensis]|uniref:Uncharacterized protein n=1 Tax=Taibaiella chishuiensis TaxID=1434707 RepID=A0A2P8CSU9_9BACT|nr:hypothetical protein B0I18_11669 [Taibaiella chishuiensis]
MKRTILKSTFESDDVKIEEQGIIAKLTSVNRGQLV